MTESWKKELAKNYLTPIKEHKKRAFHSGILFFILSNNSVISL